MKTKKKNNKTRGTKRIRGQKILRSLFVTNEFSHCLFCYFSLTQFFFLFIICFLYFPLCLLTSSPSLSHLISFNSLLFPSFSFYQAFHPSFLLSNLQTYSNFHHSFFSLSFFFHFLISLSSLPSVLDIFPSFFYLLFPSFLSSSPHSLLHIQNYFFRILFSSFFS